MATHSIRIVIVAQKLALSLSVESIGSALFGGRMPNGAEKVPFALKSQSALSHLLPAQRPPLGYFRRIEMRMCAIFLRLSSITRLGWSGYVQ